ncbi:MAG: cellulase family glycosylhydrolase [Alteromonadaceae bacterium]|nr:cellulase family glycosylhydrolase [Alteromonadaceae bacterium]
MLSKQIMSALLVSTLGLSAHSAIASSVSQPTPVTVENGKLRWANGEPVYLFGANYSAPFAYGFRAIARRGIDHKTAIDMDVDHMARLKLNAYRIHVWDKVISDKAGNVLDNQYLELFDYLMMRLQERGIRTIITPIAWWGSGYPEPDPSEPGFAVGYSKNDMNENPALIAAQQRYLSQFLAHKNRYTGKVIGQDPDIIAFELFNEPKHRQAPKQSAAYVETLITTVRDAGVNKPLFYNVSEQGNQPNFAEALCQSSIDGIAYQWYPTGLLKYSTLNTNVLPAVSTYTDPFETISACQNKARIVYEFDAADITNSVTYPAMARSFRDAGFQWATQFAYDPAVIADTNSDYNTHYMNLLYTPSKAISLMIAGEEFRSLPEDYSAPAYPDSNQFHYTTLDYINNVSLFDDGSQYYYTNTTQTSPKRVSSVEHIAGVGSSPIINYTGSGAYFLDKVGSEGWRLEVFPDVIPLQDPHQNSSLAREVARLSQQQNTIKVSLPGLGSTFVVRGVNEDNNYVAQAVSGSFKIKPGVYWLSASHDTPADLDSTYLLPGIKPTQTVVTHQPQRQRNVNEPLTFTAKVQSKTPNPSVILQLRYEGYNDFVSLPMVRSEKGQYSVSLPDDEALRRPGKLEYAITIIDGDTTLTFPGAQPGQPQDWDFINSDYYHTLLQPEGTPIPLFTPAQARRTFVAPQNTVSWPASSATKEGETVKLEVFKDHLQSGGPLLRTDLSPNATMLERHLDGYEAIALRIRALGGRDRVQFGLIANDGLAYGTDFEVTKEWKTLVIPVSALQPTPTLLTRAYPLFMPVTIGPFEHQQALSLQQITGMQLLLPALKRERKTGWRGIEIGEIALVQLD